MDHSIMQRSEDNLRELILSFYCVDSGPKSQIPNKTVLFLLGLFATGSHWHSNFEQQ